MSDNHQNPNEHPTPQIASAPDKAIDTSRRRLTGAGLGMSVIFTLASRPVLAANCVTPSAAASGNMSHHGPAPICTGQTAAAWASVDANRLPGGNSKFMDVFPNGTNATWKNSDRLADVLDATDNDNDPTKPNPISKEFAAALLNIRSGRIPSTILDELRLVGMWNDWVAGGTFNPQAGVKWEASQIVLYLQGLQD
jgi:hypothetical protein